VLQHQCRLMALCNLPTRQGGVSIHLNKAAKWSSIGRCSGWETCVSRWCGDGDQRLCSRVLQRFQAWTAPHIAFL
jgi:hypothetical protein